MNKVLSVITLFFAFNFTYAQTPEMGIFIGNTYYIGDINPYRHFNQQDFVLGGIYRNNFKNERIALRINFMYGRLKSSDFESGLELQVRRNLSFRSTILEIGPIIEVNFFPYKLGQTDTELPKFGTPYFFGGITYMKMNPKAEFEGEWVELQPLGTEGQGTSQNSRNPYSLSQITIPFGFGFKLNIAEQLAIALEYGMRKTFTDYIDDVSGLYPNQTLLAQQSGTLAAELSDRSDNPEGVNNTNYGLSRGNPNNKDWYAFTGFVLTYRLYKTTSCPTW